MLSALLILFAYLLGSVSTAIVLSRLLGLPDPRGYGSGNPGATNILRGGGKKAAAVVLLGDMLKGLVPVLIAKAVGGAEMVVGLTGLAAFIGHLYPIFFNFQGGKGVATSLGVLLGLSPLVGLAAVGTWLVIAVVFRYSSLSALVAAVLVPLYMAWLAPVPVWIASALLMSAMLLWRHRSNIEKLLSGREDKIGSKR
jgi:glycerol-3-phosphate acyltransferase PlsY